MDKARLVALSLGSLLIFALAIELGSFLILEYVGGPNGVYYFGKPHFLGSPEVYHPLTKKALPPKAQFGSHGQFTTDEHGYLKVPDRVDDAELNVVITGASSVRRALPARLNGPKDTFAYQLQMLARERLGVRVNVVTLAVDEFTSFQEMMALYEYLEYNDLPADLIVSVNGLLSASAAISWFQKTPKTLYPLYESARREQIQGLIDRRLGNGIKSDLVALGARLGESTNTGRLMATILAGLRGAPARPAIDDVVPLAPDESYIQRLAKREMLNLALMELISKRSGATFLAVLLPSKFTAPVIADNDPVFRAHRDWINAVYEAMLAQAGSLPVIDLRKETFSIPLDSVFYDPTHFTAAGTKVLAEMVFAHLGPAITVRLHAGELGAKAGGQKGDGREAASNAARKF